jgi:hypothetical protein
MIGGSRRIQRCIAVIATTPGRKNMQPYFSYKVAQANALDAGEFHR